MIEWTGAGWRLWRVEKIHRGSRLRNPWTDTTRPFWERGEVHVAECIWRDSDGSSSCIGYVSASCTCGIRSMATLLDLANFVSDGRQLIGHPPKAWVVGRVRIGGRVQHQIPALPPQHGYQRSEFAEIDGPLYVSPGAAKHLKDVVAHYGSARSPVFGPDFITGADGPHDWLELLAGAHVAGRTLDPTQTQPVT
jgi:hypothetical protein